MHYDVEINHVGAVGTEVVLDLAITDRHSRELGFAVLRVDEPELIRWARMLLREEQKAKLESQLQAKLF